MISGKTLLIAHVGFERLSSVREIVHGLPFTEPCSVKLWRIPRAEVPDDDEGRRRWLDDVWHDLDAWVAARLHPSPSSASAGTVAARSGDSSVSRLSFHALSIT